MKFETRISNLIFYLLILFLPTQLGRHFWPDFSSVSGIRVDYLAPTLYVTDILISLLFIAWILNLVGRHSGKRSASRISIVQSDSGQARMTDRHMGQADFNPFDKLRVDAERSRSIKFQIGLLATIVLMGILLSKNQLAGLYGFIKLLEFIFLGFYTAYSFKKLRFDAVLLLFSIGIIFESFLAIFQYINKTSIDGIFYFLGERTFNSQTPGIANASVNGNLVLRPYGTFSHPNVLAGYLIIAMALVSSKFKVQSSKFRNTTTAVSLVIGTLALFLTMSRVAILLWLVIMGLRFIKFSIFNFQFSIKSKFKNFNIKNSFQISNFKLKILIVGFVGVILLISPLSSRFTDIRSSDESITQRGELIKDSFSMIKSHPIFGVGLNNFLVELSNVHKQDANVFYLQPAHNIYLLILTQTGVVGLVFFIWFIFKTYQRIKNQESRIKNKKPIIHNSLFMILSTVLVLGLFDHYFLTIQQGQLLFSFVLGLCWSKSSSGQSSKKE